MVQFAALIAATASAGEVTLSGTGGYDYPTRQIYAGPELAYHAVNRKGPAFVGLVIPTWSVADSSPLVLFEGGALFVVKSPEGLVRVGAVARGAVAALSYGVPWRIATVGEDRVGVVPGLLFHTEFEYGTDDPLRFVFGVRAGLGLSQTNFACPDPGVLTPGCVVWDAGFIGALELEFRTQKGLFLDLHVGPIGRLSVGYAFGRRDDE
jgi:hypothetical protein